MYTLFASGGHPIGFNRELKQPRRRRQQKPHKFAYLTMKNSIFARFARAFLIFWHFEDVLDLSTTWNDPFCSCVDDVSIWWQMFNFVRLCPKRWFQFNSRVVETRFSSKMTLNNWKTIAETRSYIFRWRSRFRRRRGCLSFLIWLYQRWTLVDSTISIFVLFYHCLFVFFSGSYQNLLQRLKAQNKDSEWWVAFPSQMELLLKIAFRIVLNYVKKCP